MVKQIKRIGIVSTSGVPVMLVMKAHIADYLDTIKTRKLTKSDYVSALIEADMKKKKAK